MNQNSYGYYQCNFWKIITNEKAVTFIIKDHKINKIKKWNS